MDPVDEEVNIHVTTTINNVRDVLNQLISNLFPTSPSPSYTLKSIVPLSFQLASSRTTSIPHV
jgi:hypothetical protein